MVKFQNLAGVAGRDGAVYFAAGQGRRSHVAGSQGRGGRSQATMAVFFSATVKTCTMPPNDCKVYKVASKSGQRLKLLAIIVVKVQ